MVQPPHRPSRRRAPMEPPRDLLCPPIAYPGSPFETISPIAHPSPLRTRQPRAAQTVTSGRPSTEEAGGVGGWSSRGVMPVAGRRGGGQVFDFRFVGFSLHIFLLVRFPTSDEEGFAFFVGAMGERAPPNRIIMGGPPLPPSKSLARFEFFFRCL